MVGRLVDLPLKYGDKKYWGRVCMMCVMYGRNVRLLAQFSKFFLADLVQYSAPFGGERNGIVMKDITYDGIISQKDNTVHGGLGKLTDDEYGNKNLSEIGGSPWVAYNNKNPEIVFEFAEKRLLKQVMIHVNNLGNDVNNLGNDVNNLGNDVKMFYSVDILISSDNKKYTLKKTYKSNSEQNGNIDAFGVVLNIGDIVTKYLKLKFTKQSVWLLISEIMFISDSYPPKEVVPYPTIFVPPPIHKASTTKTPFGIVPVTNQGNGT